MELFIENQIIEVEDKSDRNECKDYLESVDGRKWYYNKWNGEIYLDCWTYNAEDKPVDLGALKPVYHIYTDDEGDVQSLITGYKLI